MDGYFIEWNGDCWQSVFPTDEAAKSQLHATVSDAEEYMVRECGVEIQEIQYLAKPQG